MSRLTGSVCKLCRREGVKLFLKGHRCETAKCSLTKRNYPPGQHPWARARQSEYRLQLREKQKVKRYYGVADGQFRKYFKTAVRLSGNTGENLLVLLEQRLDNVLFALGFALSRRHGRQLVAHGHVLVNGRRCNVPSAQLRSGDEVSITKRDKVRGIVKSALEERSSYPLPGWLERDGSALTGRVVAVPTRADVTFEVTEQLIVELMSK